MKLCKLSCITLDSLKISNACATCMVETVRLCLSCAQLVRTKVQMTQGVRQQAANLAHTEKLVSSAPLQRQQ